MNKIKSAAILLLTVGEKHASEILKNMNPKEVRAIIEAINKIESITDDDVIRSLNDFFIDSNTHSGIDIGEKAKIKNSLLNAMGTNGIISIVQENSSDNNQWLELLAVQPMNTLVELIQDEHPQIITAIIIVIFNNINSDTGIKLIKFLPKELQAQIFRRMTGMGSISRFSIDTLSKFFKNELEDVEKNTTITVDGLETVANIISYMDSETETQIITDLSNDDKLLGEKIQDKLFPFQKLADLDKKSLQTLLAEINSEELVIALKGVDEQIKEIFMQNMSVKSAEILRDDLEAKGPVKIANVMTAQKNIVLLAKKLASEEKIILTGKSSSDIVF